MRTGLVEVGTDALRAVVADAAPGGWYRVHAEHRVLLGLQRAIRRDGRLGAGLLDLVEETVRRLREVVFRGGATSTVGVIGAGLTEAADLDELRTRVGRVLRAVTMEAEPEEEARALVRAVRGRTDPDELTLVLDLGDHELRAVTVVDGCPTGTVSTRTGMRELLPSAAVDPFHPAVRGHVRARLRTLLDELGDVVGSARWPVVTGAAADAVARAAVARRWGRDGPDHDGLRLSRAELAAFERELASSSQTQRLLLPAIDPVEADLASLGGVVVQALVDRLGAAGVVVSRARVHDGRILELVGVPGALGDARDGAVAAAGGRAHGERAAVLVGQLFDQLAGPALCVADRQLLVDAARLHDAGREPAVGAHHRRGAAALLASGVRGCDPQTVVELASLVRFQRGRAPGQHFPPYGRLPQQRRAAVERLTGLLRLACGLDVDGSGAVDLVEAVDRDGQLELVLDGPGPLDLAMHGVQAQLPAVERLLGTAIVVRPSAHPGPSLLEPLG
jgi:exopolyphosphatase / guanosine-5'-triphosphate,3'-diphosphate pyrophosphatase